MRAAHISHGPRGFTCKVFLCFWGNAFKKKKKKFFFLNKSGPANMSLGAERRLESRLRKLEDMIRDPRSAINLESLLVSQAGHT